MMRAMPGVCSAGFTTTVFPVTSAATVMPQQQATLPDGLRWHRRLRVNGWSNALFAGEGADAGNEGRPLPMVETLCLENVPVTQKRPRAVDLEAERRLLGQLRDKRTEASARAEREIARCRTLYPEG